MAKKLAEEAIEVVIDAVNGKADAVVRESADLLYNLTVLWAAAGVRPADVWREMERRELMLGIAEKLPKSAVKLPKAISGKLVPSKTPPKRRPRRQSGGGLCSWKAAACASGTNSPQIFPICRHGQIRSMMVHAPMLKRIYDWCIDAADKPYALWILAAVAFAESSFFPVPPDIMLLPMSLARPKRAWWFASVCTIASVAGGVLGYAIGALLYDSVGQWLINLYGLSGKVEAFRASYAEWGAVIILVKGLTPIPYKLVTITSGFAGYNIWLFILCSIVAGRRFFVVAVLLTATRPHPGRTEKRLGLWVAIGAAVLVLGFYIAFRLI
jgi:membrane protein YqaA with SNARE-associated domain